MRHLAVLLVLLSASALTAAEKAPVVKAHVVGERIGKEDEVVVVTAEEQRVFEHRAEFVGGGICASTVIRLEEGRVVVEDFDNVGTLKDGIDHLRTIINRYTVPLDKADGWSVKLHMGNITLTVEDSEKTAERKVEAEP